MTENERWLEEICRVNGLSSPLDSLHRPVFSRVMKMWANLVGLFPTTLEKRDSLPIQLKLVCIDICFCILKIFFLKNNLFYFFYTLNYCFYISILF